jgi:hypothetical protein
VLSVLACTTSAVLSLSLFNVFLESRSCFFFSFPFSCLRLAFVSLQGLEGTRRNKAGEGEKGRVFTDRGRRGGCEERKKGRKGEVREKRRGGNGRERKSTERRGGRRESEGTRERKGEKGEKEGGGEKERKGEEGKEGGKKEGRSLVLEDDVTARGRKRKGQ